MAWFQFMDMHSGGGQKLNYGQLFIEAASESEACAIFEQRFDRYPHNVTCECCGEDYSISEHVSLAQATGYERGCRCLQTPRVDGRFQSPDDPYFSEHYYLEDGEEPRAPYTASARYAHTHYVALEDYLKREDVFSLSAEQRAKEQS